MSNFIIFCCVIGLVAIYWIYLLIGMRHLTKEYAHAKRALDTLPACYGNTKTKLYLCITKTAEKWWLIEYKNEKDLGYSTCRETLRESAELMVDILTKANII